MLFVFTAYLNSLVNSSRHWTRQCRELFESISHSESLQ